MGQILTTQSVVVWTPSCIVARAAATAEEGRARCGVAHFEETPDFMTRIAGVGRGLLRVNAPELSSVLLMEVDGEVAGRRH